MRIAALIIALFAGLVGTAITAFGVFDNVVLSLVGLGVSPAGAARFLLYLVPELVLLGAGLALGAPFVSAFALLLGALGWAGITAAAGQGALFAFGLVAFTAVAFLFALIAALRGEGGADTSLEPLADEPAVGTPVAGRLLPTQRLPRPSYVPVAHRPHIDGDGEEAEEGPTPAASTAPFAEDGYDEDDEPYVSGPADNEDSRAEDAPVPGPPAFASDAASAHAYEPAIAQQSAPFGPGRNYFGEPREIVPPFEAFDPGRARRRSGWRRAVSALAVVFLLALAGGGGLLLYLDHQRGPGSAIFGDGGLLARLDGGPAYGPSPAPAAARELEPVSAPPPVVEPAGGLNTASTASTASAPPASEPPAGSNPDVSPLAPPIPTVDNTAPDQRTQAETMNTASAPAFDAVAPAPSEPAAEPPVPASDIAGARESAGPAPAAPAMSDIELAQNEAPAQAEPLPNDPDAPIPAPPPADRLPSPPSDAVEATRPAPEAAAEKQAAEQPDAQQPAAEPEPAAKAPSPAPPPTTYADAFAYCEAVGTIDTPDSRYTGPAVPSAVATKLGATTAAEIAAARWRCMSRNVMACRPTDNKAACQQLPTADAMIAYCRANSDVARIPVPSGYWMCENGRPIIPKGQHWPVDRRGFYPPAWTPVPNIAAVGG